MVGVEVEFLALQTVRFVEEFQRPGARVEPGEAVVRAQPEAILVVRLDAPDHLARQVHAARLVFEMHLGG